MFQKAERIAQGIDPWPWVGMQSGVGTENPGASVWAFTALAHVTDTPEGMTFAVMLLNVLALWAFAAWVMKLWPEDDREVGLGGLALFAVSPLPVLFSRKIWAQDLLPVLLVPWYIGHSLRHRAWAAFIFGFISALMGQLHLSGFFAAASMWIATLIYDRKGTRWLSLLGGATLGALPMLPWLQFLLSGKASTRPRLFIWSIDYFWEGFKLTWGVNLRYTMHKNFGEFLRSPRIGETNTWFIGGLHIALCLLALACVIIIAIKFRSLRLSQPLRIYATAIVLTGVLLHALGVLVYVHYLIVWSPLLHIATAWMLSHRRHLLAVCITMQLIITSSFLWFIHTHGGAPRGDFGVSYGAQTEEQRRDGPTWP